MDKIMSAEQFNELVKARRSVFPDSYTTKAIPKEVVMQILENANWAPTHRRTDPWRFKVMMDGALERLSGFMVADYLANTKAEAQSTVKEKKARNMPLMSGAVIAICVELHPELLPEWEEVAAVACAVENMWLTCAAYGIGCYWSTPGAMGRMGAFLGLKESERCIGLFYMGYSDGPTPAGKRNPIEDKVEWL